MAKSWSYKLDPTHYLRLYINKVYQESFNTGAVHLQSQPAGSITKSFQGTSGSLLQQSEQTTSSSMIASSSGPMSAASEMYSTQSMMKDDIVGLTVIEASPQYITKFNTLRQHLIIQEHPVVKILNLFRESILQFIKESEDSIKQLLTFYDRENPNTSLTSEKAKTEHQEYEKLLKRLIREIKSFVELMHDAVVRFYKLDVKTSMDVSQCECLTNLLTSIILKNPIYSYVHSIFQ